MSKLSSHEDLNTTRGELKSIEKGSLLYVAREYERRIFHRRDNYSNKAFFFIPPEDILGHEGAAVILLHQCYGGNNIGNRQDPYPESKHIGGIFQSPLVKSSVVNRSFQSKQVFTSNNK